MEKNIYKIGKELFITSDEVIKEGDWVIDKNGLLAKVITELTWHFINSKKIILTTDQDLISDGVQPIDDEFLEWFVKNPSCEFVEVGYGWIRLTETNNEGYWISIPDNKLELKIEEPKQETIQQFIEKHDITEQQLIDGYKQGLDLIFENASKITKQETLEEAAENFANSKEWINGGASNWVQFSFKEGANWQSERMYSEEEVIAIVEKSRETGLTAEYLLLTDQFKKK